MSVMCMGRSPMHDVSKPVFSHLVLGQVALEVEDYLHENVEESSIPCATCPRTSIMPFRGDGWEDISNALVCLKSNMLVCACRYNYACVCAHALTCGALTGSDVAAAQQECVTILTQLVSMGMATSDQILTDPDFSRVRQEAWFLPLLQSGSNQQIPSQPAAS